MSERVNITRETAKDGTKSITYSKSWQVGNMNHNKEVRQVEGGYIVTESKHGSLPSEGDEKSEYIDERKEYVTTENPFEPKEEKSDDQKMFDFIDTPLM